MISCCIAHAHSILRYHDNKNFIDKDEDQITCNQQSRIRVNEDSMIMENIIMRMCYYEC